MRAIALRLCQPTSIIALVGLLALSTAGCGDGATGSSDRKKTVPVTGSVVENGKPVEGASITFMAKQGGGGFGAFATTDAQGKFSLRTYVPGDGAVPGEYKVIISKVKRSGELTTEQAQEYASKGKQPPDPIETDLLPKTFKDVNKTPLTATVKADGPNDLPPFEVGK